MTMTRLMVTAFVLVTLVAGGVLADRAESVSDTVRAEGISRLNVDLEFGAGEIDIIGEDMADAARFDLYYSPRWVTWEKDYSTKDSTGYLILASKSRHRSGNDNVDNEWRVVLSNRYPVELQMEIGACEGDIDLGGIPLTEVDIDMGAASARIDFSKPNPQRLRDLTIDVGASSCKLTNLGNANVERMVFRCGAADCELDFRGEFHGETQVDVEVGVGSAEIILPKGIGIRVEGNDGWFSSLDLHGLRLDRVGRDLWETEGFDQATDKISIQVDVGMGSVDIYSRQ
jgi:hypothetical protein